MQDMTFEMLLGLSHCMTYRFMMIQYDALAIVLSMNADSCPEAVE